MPRTKIVCTIGPASRDKDILRGLMRAGMNVARINFSHGKHAAHERDINLIRHLAQEEGCAPAIIADLQGPKFRVGTISGDPAILEKGRQVILTTRPVDGSAGEITLPHPELIHSMKPGNQVFLDDGLLELRVESVSGEDACCTVINGGPLRSHKGVALVGGKLNMPAVTDKDRRDLAFVARQDVDYVAQSFVRTSEDIVTLRMAMEDVGTSLPIIAKIEKAEAIENFDEILSITDGIMVARGDLGVESPLAEVPMHQKHMIAKANQAGKPVITATQMLDSMTTNPRPTRAEVSDVANAVLDGTDAVMLSAETAVGKYPVRVVQTMTRIIKVAEESLPYDVWAREAVQQRAYTVIDAIGQAAVEISEELGAAAIICPTRSGHTGRVVARYRPRAAIFATTPNPATLRQLALVWGVQSRLIESSTNTDDVIAQSIEMAVENLSLRKGNRIVVTAGVPFTQDTRMNMVQIHTV
jgi:pyruvate kinase